MNNKITLKQAINYFSKNIKVMIINDKWISDCRIAIPLSFFRQEEIKEIKTKNKNLSDIKNNVLLFNTIENVFTDTKQKLNYRNLNISNTNMLQAIFTNEEKLEFIFYVELLAIIYVITNRKTFLFSDIKDLDILYNGKEYSACIFNDCVIMSMKNL